VQKLEDKNNHFESELRNAHADMNRSKIEDRNKKNVDTLKKTFSGVLGRVSDLCKVCDPQFWCRL
jgi:chromosome segregation ATPase